MMFQDFLNYSICVVPRLIAIMYQRIVKLQKEFINIEYYEDRIFLSRSKAYIKHRLRINRDFDKPR